MNIENHMVTGESFDKYMSRIEMEMEKCEFCGRFVPEFTTRTLRCTGDIICASCEESLSITDLINYSGGMEDVMCDVVNELYKSDRVKQQQLINQIHELEGK